jgi:serine phosphatase RsbU (regulator of sigma subunit)
MEEPAPTVGVHLRARPSIDERPLAAGQVAVAFTDGVLRAGERRSTRLDVRYTLGEMGPPAEYSAAMLADAVLHAAVAADAGRPTDDTTVVVIKVVEAADEDGLEVRRMSVSFPVSPT